SYIQTASPVGSSTLSKYSDFGLSAATIRNVMADLESEGFLEQPHTSAGRVPTEQGFRFYIDCLLKVEPLEEQVKQVIRQSIEGNDTASILQNAGRMLSGLSQHVGVILAPKRDVSKLQHIEFLPLRETQILAILVTEQGVVQNRIFETETPLSRGDLIRMNNYLNSVLSGLNLGEVKQRILMEMARHQDTLDRLLKQALVLSQQVVSGDSDDLIIDGEKNFLYTQEFSNLGKIRDILSALDEKHRLVAFLDHAIKAPGVQIFVGSESQMTNLEDCSVIVANYGTEAKPLGTLGVIGPTRMEYSKLIPMVEFTAKSLGDILKG
ncbi:MAG: heat-inducible transcriptional repressor HrcA, partial [Deltaproteobacteria bacterium]|nr:heat-inducible transcriptional repressor HrcA [Deltaproteobacteria bacterium]